MRLAGTAVELEAPAPATTYRPDYQRTDERCASFERLLLRYIARYAPQTVCDIGGGANPMLPRAYLEKHQIRCVLLDVCAAELAKAPAGYSQMVADIAAPSLPPAGEQFDLIFSRMLAEHVRSGEHFHRNVFRLLRPGGVAVHCFPTLYSIPFLMNRAMPESWADAALRLIQPRDRHQYAKFPAYYDWCRGPSARAWRRLERLGYEVVQYTGMFGHPYYGEHGPLAWLHRGVTTALLWHPVNALTSYAFLVLRRPVVTVFTETEVEAVPVDEVAEA